MKTTEYIHLNSDDSKHEWEKINLMTIVKNGKRSHDIWKCKKCGMEAYLYTLGILEIETSSQSKIDKFKKCPKYVISLDSEPWDNGQEISIIKVLINNKAADNLIPNSKHKIVEPDPEYKTKFPNSNVSVWVMGIGEPIRLLANEFNFIK